MLASGHTVRVTLNFNNHLLQTPNELFATFLRHLGGQEILGALAILGRHSLCLFGDLSSLLTVFRRNILLCTLLQSLLRSSGTSTGIDLGDWSIDSC